MNKKIINKKDLVIILSILFIALILSFFGQSGDVVEITVERKTVAVYPLGKPFEINLGNGVTISGDGEYAYFSHSDCPDKVCINTGKLSLSGEWAACLPNKTVIKIKGKDGGADTVS